MIKKIMIRVNYINLFSDFIQLHEHLFFYIDYIYALKEVIIIKKIKNKG